MATDAEDDRPGDDSRRNVRTWSSSSNVDDRYRPNAGIYMRKDSNMSQYVDTRGATLDVTDKS